MNSTEKKEKAELRKTIMDEAIASSRQAVRQKMSVLEWIIVVILTIIITNIIIVKWPTGREVVVSLLAQIGLICIALRIYGQISLAIRTKRASKPKILYPYLMEKIKIQIRFYEEKQNIFNDLIPKFDLYCDSVTTAFWHIENSKGHTEPKKNYQIALKSYKVICPLLVEITESFLRDKMSEEGINLPFIDCPSGLNDRIQSWLLSEVQNADTLSSVFRRMLQYVIIIREGRQKWFYDRLTALKELEYDCNHNI